MGERLKPALFEPGSLFISLFFPDSQNLLPYS